MGRVITRESDGQYAVKRLGKGLLPAENVVYNSAGQTNLPRHRLPYIPLISRHG